MEEINTYLNVCNFSQLGPVSPGLDDEDVNWHNDSCSDPGSPAGIPCPVGSTLWLDKQHKPVQGTIQFSLGEFNNLYCHSCVTVRFAGSPASCIVTTVHLNQ